MIKAGVMNLTSERARQKECKEPLYEQIGAELCQAKLDRILAEIIRPMRRNSSALKNNIQAERNKTNLQQLFHAEKHFDRNKLDQITDDS
jgi:hypothetical protein